MRLAGFVVGSVLLALGSGGLLGWLQRRSVPPREQTSTAITPEEATVPRAMVVAKEREEELKKVVQQYAHPETPKEAGVGMDHCIDLAQFYLKERKFGEAAEFFKELSDPAKTKTAAYRSLGRIGHAILLAYQDEFVESNKEFSLLAADLEKYPGKAKLREMVARAVQSQSRQRPATISFPKAGRLPFPASAGTSNAAVS